DISTGSVQSDKIEILSSNTTSNSNAGLTSNIDFQIYDTIQQENGYLDGSRVVITSENVDSNGIPLEPNQFREIVPNWTGEDSVKYGGILVFQENDDFTISVLSLPNDTFTILDSSWAYTMDQALAETNAYKRSEFVRNNAIRSTTLSGIYSKGSGFMVGFKYDGKYYFIEQTVGNNNGRLNQLIENLTYSDDTTAATPELAFYRAIVNIGTNA
ncbi:hypothetical protein ACFQ07_11625, partial [Actinomadura adrarensis]